MTDLAFWRLRSHLRGTLVLPGDEGYDDARAVWNAAIDRRPAAVVHCADPTDVVRALELDRARSLPVAVRGGGHGFAGKATCDGGLVIDCSPMQHVDVDPARRVARAGAGRTLVDLDAATPRPPPAGPPPRGGPPGGPAAPSSIWTRRRRRSGSRRPWARCRRRASRG